MNNTTDLLQIKIEKAKAQLPENTLNAINAVPWQAIILQMRETKGYSFDQLGELETETELLLCGLLNPENYRKELKDRMKLSDVQVNDLINEMNKLVFIKKMRKKSFDEATGLTNNTIRSQYTYLYDGSINDLQIEDGKSQGFVVWKIDDLSHLSETDKNKFIPLILEKDMLDIFNQAREILLK